MKFLMRNYDGDVCSEKMLACECYVQKLNNGGDEVCSTKEGASKELIPPLLELN